jgi:hypothetical protein
MAAMSRRSIFIVLATACLAAAAPAAAAPPPAQCVPSANVGCANHGRFRIEVAWQNQFNGTSGAGVVVTRASTDQTLAFSFGDPANIELIVKILNFGGVVKLFYGELTNLSFQITVTDTAHGTVKVYTNTAGDCGEIDETAFPGQSSAAALARGMVSSLEAAGAGSCRAGATTLCLLGGRFAASVIWQNQFNGTSGTGKAGSLSDITGTFYFTDPGNKELLVKVLNLGDRIGVFYGTLSDLQYALTVTDTASGISKTYLNPAGTFCGGLDNAFPTSGFLLESEHFSLIPVPIANQEHSPDDILLVPFAATSAGNLEVEADWMSAADHIRLVLFTGTCTIQEAMNNQCDPNQIGVADQMVKPQILTFPNLPPGTYTAMVIDFGPNNESGKVTISLAH